MYVDLQYKYIVNSCLMNKYNGNNKNNNNNNLMKKIVLYLIVGLHETSRLVSVSKEHEYNFNLICLITRTIIKIILCSLYPYPESSQLLN